MKQATIDVDAGICGFQTKIVARGDDMQEVTFAINSDCPKIRQFGETLTAQGPVDGYAEIGAGIGGVILTTSHGIMKGCCAGCAVHAATFKAMQVAAGLALPKQVTMQMDNGATGA